MHFEYFEFTNLTFFHVSFATSDIRPENDKKTIKKENIGIIMA
jgi:hypothetical protein